MPSRSAVPAGVFAPRPSRQESKADSTTTAARQIVEAERRAKDAKTARLRELRLAAAETETPAAAKPRRKSARAK